MLQGEEEENKKNVGWIQYMKEMNIIASKQQIGKSFLIRMMVMVCTNNIKHSKLYCTVQKQEVLDHWK